MNGKQRFEYFLQQFETLLQQASKEKNMALWLYSNNARTPMFMLEGLAKLYGNLHNKKKFGKLKEHFKLVEDTLGAIDYYDNAAKDLESNQNISSHIKEYFKAQAREKIQSLNEILVEEKWLGEQASRCKKIREKLDEAAWLSSKEEAHEIEKFYMASIREIIDFINGAGEGFTEMETQVHEIRRELRWLSIYPQALRGLIQLSNTTAPDPHTTKYLTTEITGSPFNQMPKQGSHTSVLLLEQQYFLSLSWVIAAIGDIKDRGLLIFAIAEALQQTENKGHEAALDEACRLMGNNHTLLNNLLSEATAICKRFVEEAIPDKLVVGVKSY